LPSIVCCLLSVVCCLLKQNQQIKTTVYCLLLFASPPCRQNPFKCLSHPTVSIPFVAGCSCLLYLSGHAADLLLTTLTLLSIFVSVISSQPVSKLPAMQITGYGSYVVRPYGDSTAAVIKYPTQALSPLPPAILPCTPIDTPDFRYLNHSHAPLPHPILSPFNIQMCNNMWLSLRCHRVLF
jgi:hypothetical protein